MTVLILISIKTDLIRYMRHYAKSMFFLWTNHQLNQFSFIHNYGKQHMKYCLALYFSEPNSAKYLVSF